MSKFDELKKQHKDLALNDLDLMKMAVPDQASKYVEVLAKLAKSKYKEIAGSHGGEDVLRRACLETLANWGIDYNYLETLETPVLWSMWNRIENTIGQSNVKLFLKFANLNERKLIDNNDVTSYKSFDEIETAVSLAEIKLIDKELEKQIIKVYEDDEWLSIKPLSLEASMKYGASTKWCTTMDAGKYFARYSRWGILIYNINKKTGFKFATFKNLDRDRDQEFSFWNMADSKIDPLDTPEIPISLIGIIRNEVNNNVVTNRDLMTEQTQKLLTSYEEDEEPRFTVRPNLTSINYITSNTGNFSIGTNTPSTQLSISGNVEINDGDLILRSNGEERMRITSTGGDNIGLYTSQPVTNERIDESRTRLQELMDEMVNEAHERVAEERAQQQSLLGDLELGTLNEDYKRRLQVLAGIDPNNIASPEPPIEEQMEQAEQTDVSSEQSVNWFNKIYEKIKVYTRTI